jgi:exopolysaccharide biosynthesis polyprenyl glycosylphosphotransferase
MASQFVRSTPPSIENAQIEIAAPAANLVYKPAPLARSTGFISAIGFGVKARYRSFAILGLESLWLFVTSLVLVILAYRSMGDMPPLQFVAQQAVMLAALYLGVFYMMDLYNFELMTTRRALLLNLVQSLGILCVIFGILEFTTDLLVLNTHQILFQLALVTVFVVAARSVVDRLTRFRRPLFEFAILGAPEMARQIASEAKFKDLGLSFQWVGDNVRGAVGNLARMRDSRSSVRRVLVDPACFSEQESAEFFLNCRRMGVEVEDLATFRERAFGKAALGPDLIHDVALFPPSGSKLGSASRRAIDILLSFWGLILTAPIAALVSIAIKCDSPGPILFTQERVGKNGKTFRMFKFRSMYLEPKFVQGYEWTTHANDPRITRVGALLRKLHLDELPQLLNVLRGDMSLVGPRPFHREHVAHLQNKLPYFKLRELVTPGITGWAQIRCDYSASVENYEEVLARDLYYVKHAGILFDLLILFDTIRIVIWRRGSR